MSTFTPNFDIEVPTPNTLWLDLGKELLAFGMSVDQVLKSFDYNGADPNKLLSRVVALETWRTSTTKKLQQLEAATGLLRGTEAEREARTPLPGQRWQDTNGLKRLWSCGPDGKWRQHEGKVSFPAGPWQTNASPFFGRTVMVTLPAPLAANETVLLTHEGGSTGFSVASMSGIIRNPTTTDVAFRHMQFASNTPMPGILAWQIVTF